VNKFIPSSELIQCRGAVTFPQ